MTIEGMPLPSAGVGPTTVTHEDIVAVSAMIAGAAHRTPIQTSSTLDALTGARVFLKCENFQRAGVFKFRGPYNALARLGPEQRGRGVLTYSSGNHAQALALAGKLLGAPIKVVMPADAPAVKSPPRKATAARSS